MNKKKKILHHHKCGTNWTVSKVLKKKNIFKVGALLDHLCLKKVIYLNWNFKETCNSFDRKFVHIHKLDPKLWKLCVNFLLSSSRRLMLQAKARITTFFLFLSISQAAPPTSTHNSEPAKYPPNGANLQQTAHALNWSHPTKQVIPMLAQGFDQFGDNHWILDKAASNVKFKVIPEYNYILCILNNWF